MKFLVWQWGRYGAGPRFAVDLAAGLNALPRVQASLSLSSRAEILRRPSAPACAMPVATYSSVGGFLARGLSLPVLVPALERRVRNLAPDVAICAMPGPLDLAMHWALRRAGVPYAVVVHDADPHPGDGYPMQMGLQRRLVRRADALVTLTGHVAGRLAQQGLVRGRPMLRVAHPPTRFDSVAHKPPMAHGGALRLLSFGRLLPYKGLDLLADSLALLPADAEIEIRVVGEGPQSPALDALRALPRVSVENRWVPESELGDLLGWADAVVLSHREASQSGVAAAALAAGRWVVSTRVGGLGEQLEGEPSAILCEPDAASLAAAIGQLRSLPPPASGGDATWRASVAGLAEGLRRLVGPG